MGDGGAEENTQSGCFLWSTRTGTGSGFLVLAARARQAIKSPILTIYVPYTIGNVWRERVAITAPVRTRAALEMLSLPSNVTHSAILVCPSHTRFGPFLDYHHNNDSIHNSITTNAAVETHHSDYRNRSETSIPLVPLRIETGIYELAPLSISIICKTSLTFWTWRRRIVDGLIPTLQSWLRSLPIIQHNSYGKHVKLLTRFELQDVSDYYGGTHSNRLPAAVRKRL